MAHDLNDDLRRVVSDFESFLDATDDARRLSERDRDYRDHKQWTTEEEEELKRRQQKATVINRIAPKVDALMGIEQSRRTDPMALPRTLEHEKAADAITDALRYVEDNTDFDLTASNVFENQIVEGYGAAIIDVEQRRGQFEIEITQIHWDRFYYDPHSRRKDFKDAKYLGIIVWMDKEDAMAAFKAKADDIETLFHGGADVDGTTFEDRPQWIDRKRERVRIAQHYFKRKGVWHVAYFTRSLFLIEPKPSPYLDEDGEPECPIEAQSAYVDRDNDRYGVVRAWIDIQDEINHRRSKALYMLSSRSIVADKGAVPDRQRALAELRKAQGYVEVTPNSRFEIQPNTDMGQGQFELLAEAKQEIDTVGINPELAGRGSLNQSGRALIARQQGGLQEITPILDGHRAWKKRVYRQIWHRIKQFWDKERWVRVTDDQNALKWIGLNIPVRKIDALLQQRTGMDIQDIQKQFGERIQAVLQQRPDLAEQVSVINNVAELDVDILVEDAPDTTTIQQEQFEVVAQLAQAYGPQFVPFEAVLKLSSMRHKDSVLDLIQGDEQQKQAAAQQQQQQQQIALQAQLAEIEKTKAETEHERASALDEAASAQQRQVESSIKMAELARPPDTVAVNEG